MQINAIIDSCHKSMSRSALLMDANCTLITQTAPPESLSLFDPLTPEKLDPYATAPYIISGKDGRRIMVANIVCSQAIAGYLMVQEGAEFFQAQDSDYVKIISLALAGAMHVAAPAEREYTKERIVLDLLQDRQIYPDIINEKRHGLQLNPAKQYQVLAIDRRFKQPDESTHSLLAEMLHTELYVYNYYYIAILQSDKYQSFRRQDFKELLKFLHEQDMYAGLSQGFDNIAELRQFFLQSAKSIELGVHCYKNIRFYRYEDYITTHMLEICKAKTDLINFCHPAVIRIHKYDEEHGTDYLRTLGVYLFSGHNMQKSAKILFVHRNTLYRHIVKLREEFGINFEDWRLHSRLTLSLIVYNYLNILDLSEFT